MPRYFFHVRDGRDMPDLEGTELANIDEARVEAVRFAGSLLNEHGTQFWQGQNWHMKVTDETGLMFFQLDFTATESPSVRHLPFKPRTT